MSRNTPPAAIVYGAALLNLKFYSILSRLFSNLTVLSLSKPVFKAPRGKNSRPRIIGKIQPAKKFQTEFAWTGQSGGKETIVDQTTANPLVGVHQQVSKTAM